MLRTVLAAKPDRSSPFQIAYHDPLSVPFANRHLVSADHLGGGITRTRELRLHVLHFQLLNRVPVEVEFLGHVLDGRRATARRHTGGDMFSGKRLLA